MVRQGIQQAAHQLRGKAIKWQWCFVKENVFANFVDADVDQRHEFLLVVLRLLLLGRAASVGRAKNKMYEDACN